MSGLDDMRDNYDGALDELAEMRRVLRDLVCGVTTKERAAWWLAANFRSDVASDWPLRRMAEASGTPPTGGTWGEWFDKR